MVLTIDGYYCKQELGSYANLKNIEKFTNLSWKYRYNMPHVWTGNEIKIVE